MKIACSALTCAILTICVTLFSPESAQAQDWAKAKLSQSTRHREYVQVTHDGRAVNTFVVYPEVKDKASVVVLIHEVFGLSDWVKLQADELAARGFIVLAPDLLSGTGPGGGGSDAFNAASGGQDATVKAVSGLDPGQVNADLNAVADYGSRLPSSNGKLAVAGFCWGGGKSFAFATQRSDLRAAFVFYGPPPPSADMAKVAAPVFGFYAGNDERINATVPGTISDMKAAGKYYQSVTYQGAGHGFMRAGQTPEADTANKKAFEEASARLIAELKKMR